MTVLRPSLPPVSCRTTRMLSLERSGRLAPSAKASWETKAGLVAERLMTGRALSPTLRRLRREVFMEVLERKFGGRSPPYQCGYAKLVGQTFLSVFFVFRSF